MTDENRTGLPVFRLVTAAIVLGLLGGAGGVYMMTSGSGNGAAAASVDCSDARGRVDAVKPLIQGQVAALIPANPPRPIQGLTFKGPDGKPMTLADFKGKTVLLNLWATWCIPCRSEMPALNSLQRDFGGEKFEVAAINIDTGDDQKPIAFRKEIGIDRLAFYRDDTLSAFNRLKKEGLAFGLPATLIIDPKGCLIASMNGPAAWDSDDAKSVIKAVTNSI